MPIDISKMIEAVARGKSASRVIDKVFEAEEASKTPFSYPEVGAAGGAPLSNKVKKAPTDGEDLIGSETSMKSPLSKQVEAFLRLFEEEKGKEDDKEDMEEADDEGSEFDDDEDYDSDGNGDEDDLDEEEDEDLDEEMEPLEEEDDEEEGESDDEESEDSEGEDSEEDDEPKKSAPKSSDGDEVAEKRRSFLRKPVVKESSNLFQTGNEVRYTGSTYGFLSGTGKVLTEMPHTGGYMYLCEFPGTGGMVISEEELSAA